ncbi:MAG: SpoIIIAH-like family protein [Christensenellales bacterium]
MDKTNGIMKSKRNRYLLLAALIIALAGVGCLNYVLGNEAGNLTADTSDTGDIEGALSMDDLAVLSSKNYFYDYKTNRENVREAEVAYLDSLITSELSDAETVKDAQSQKIQIVKNMESELTIEGLLMAIGFEDAIVTVQTGSVNVVLKKSDITKEEAAQVLEIVRKETGEPAQNIKVILQG